MSPTALPLTLGAALALTLGGCAPETVTPLRATDGEPPAKDRAVELDETVAPRDVVVDRGASDAGCPVDGGPDGSPDGSCVTDAEADTQRDSSGEDRRRPAAGAD